MFCKNCGAKLREGAAFCLNCGTKVTTTEAPTDPQLPQRGTIHVEESVTSQKKGTDAKKRIPFIILGIVIVVLVGIIIALVIGRKDASEVTDDNSNVTEEETVAPPLVEELQSEGPVSEEAQTEEKLMEEAQNEEAQAGEMQTEDTSIHRYELIVADVTWTDAYDDCLNRGGYLVHINSQEEFDFITKQIMAEDKSNIIFWLGASRAADSDTYYWLNRDGTYGTVNLNNNPAYDDYWLPGEPSLQGTDADGQTADESYVDMFYRSSENRFFWNDAPNDIVAVINYYAGRIGYICEYED